VRDANERKLPMLPSMVAPSSIPGDFDGQVGPFSGFEGKRDRLLLSFHRLLLFAGQRPLGLTGLA